ncbi:MAG: transaldolase family protein [Synechocystis sp.]|nr:transaldolase family protein [Synechocystis sp.]
MIYLDSALIETAEKLTQLGWVKGITTNPTLLAQSPLSPPDTLQALAKLSPGELYYQLISTRYEEMVVEGRFAREVIGPQTVLKIPATPTGFQALATLSKEITCSVTAIYHPAQAAIASEAGAKYAIAYVNRATRLLGDGLALVNQMAQVLAHRPTEILAASIKSADEAAQALMAGADHLTLPWDILEAMAHHPLSEQTLLDFNQQGKGLDWH